MIGVRGAALVLLLTLAAPLQAAEFVGTAACRGCHEAEHEAWQGTHHDLAMQHATPGSVLGDFAGAELTHGDVTSTFSRRGDRFFVRTDNEAGKLQEFEVRYTFGVSPLQQYLVEFADGRIQALATAWDTRPADAGGQRWFHLYRDQHVDHDHALHWTGSEQNWNYMCASCHSTHVQKGYDAKADRFVTTWSDIDVGCEACHGPGSEHVAWAGLDSDGRARDTRMGLLIRLSEAGRPWQVDEDSGSARPRSPDDPGRHLAATEITMCAGCHARRSQLADGARAHEPFLDNHMPALLTEGLYHPDGQIHDEVFVWGSFAQSRMHEAGVRCSDCHDPHTLALRAPGDAVCAQCHLPARFASRAHHRHEPGSTACVDCHMPASTYMVVDPRRDHSLRIPRPDRSVALGVPNACNGCHTDRTAQWAADHYRDWYPDGDGGQQTWAEAFAAARAGDPRVEDDLVALIEDGDVPAIARATAVDALGPFLSPRSGQALQDALADDSPLVRIAALRTLEVLPLQQRYPFARPALSDELLAVRAEAGRVLGALPESAVPAAERTTWRRAVADYEGTQAFNADRAQAHTNLGSLYAQRGQIDRARRAFERAIELDPQYPPAYANLADLLRSEGQDGAAVQVLERGIAAQPDAAPLYHALGLAQVRLGQRDAAMAPLRKAADLAPQSPRFAYVYAVALNDSGDIQASLGTLRDALSANPYDRDLLFALATIARDAQDLQAARDAAQRLLALHRDPEALQLARSLGL